ncbi:protein retinal degeneration B-like [Eurosta solidaginis]|uniref:protein retinal degeneration B-like n=1 Tax=Eurosta solidaginis TaxID=178769 RepID=UPI003530F103
MSLMCAYKICRVEFRYWGMQKKIAKFIHDVALRKTMVRAHRQAWAWQDEWYGLTIDDIHEMERQTQQALAKKMCGAEGSESDAEDADSIADLHGRPITSSTGSERRKSSGVPPPIVTQEPPSADRTSDEDEENAGQEVMLNSIHML